MAVDTNWIDTVARQFLDQASIPVEGIPLELPAAKARERKQWQGLVSDDILPDSVNADAPEKIPFEILKRLTDSTRTKRSLREALADGTRFAPLRPLFVFSTLSAAEIPVAFHVLAVKAVDKIVNSKGFTDKTFLLLMRDEAGNIDEQLVRRLIEHFRMPPAHLDLAQRTVLEQVQPDWSPDTEFQISLTTTGGLVPFVPAAGQLLRRDLRTLLDARLTRADFFRYTNQLMALHLGLYQPRLAAHVSPAVAMLLQEMAQPDSVEVEAVERIERGEDPAHSFFASLDVLAPEGATRRRIAADMPARRSFEGLRARLAGLHFDLTLLNRVREVVHTFLVAKGYDEDAARSISRKPSQMVQRMHDSPDFRRYFARACEALAVRFAHEQLDDASRDDALADLRRAPSGLHALRDFYQRYNLQTSARATSSRAYKNGEQVVRRLLSMGENGLLQMRRGSGGYFSIGSGLLPLLLITALGPRAEKIPVRTLWHRLGEYGLRLSVDEQDRLLGRLKAMGLYERYSDAGEASYVRGLITAGEAA